MTNAFNSLAKDPNAANVRVHIVNIHEQRFSGGTLVLMILTALDGILLMPLGDKRS